MGSKIKWSMLYLENKLKLVRRKGLFFGMADHREAKRCSNIISMFFRGKGGPPNLSLP